MARTVHLVPHTHWDREWYKPFPVFRMQLVELLDGLLPQMVDDESFADFQLDGQLAVVDDYLEIRPEQRPALDALNRAGRISMGPWYTLPDEFLVSGETLVRDLRLGMATAAGFGGSMTIGYLPDMFGHVAQMPQILAGFAMTDAVVWRGVPSAIDAPAFWWEAPDGTRVRATYLAQGYGNGAHLPEHGKELVEQFDAFCEAEGDRAGSPLLWMNGTDHQLPVPRLGRVVAEANEADDRYEVVVSSLADHVAASPTEGLPTWSGELRSGARANLLMGVASARVDVKQAAARAERWLERVAEPLATCFPAPEGYPSAFLDWAWREVIRNAAHDSICGCSADEVNNAVLHRYAEATRVAEAIADRALIRVLADSHQDAVAVNPTARTRAAVVRAVLGGDVAPPHSQQLSIRAARERTDAITRTTALPVLQRAIIDDPKVSHVTLDEHDDGTIVATIHADRGPKAQDMTALRLQLEALAEADPEGVVHLEVQRPRATQEVLLRTAPVPGLGWRGLAPADLGATAVRPEGQGITNGLITVIPDQSTGTFAVNGIEGMGRIVDDGDAGDTYNWSPPTFHGAIDRPDHVDVLVSEVGPVRGRIEIARTYRWPTHIADGRRHANQEVVVRTEVDLHAGEDIVGITVRFENHSKDHRVRMWFPLPEPAATSAAECAFGTVTRGLTAEGGPNEVGLATYPSRRFVSAGGLQVAHDGLLEYELVDVQGHGDEARASSIAITLLRSVGVISAGPMAMRALPAGPPTPTPDAQLLGDHELRLAVHVGGRDPYAVADEAFTPILTARFPGGDGLGDPGASGQALDVRGAEVSAVTTRPDGRIELRAVNTTDQPATLTIAGRRGERTDLRGEPTGQAFDGAVELRPSEIATLALDPA